MKLLPQSFFQRATHVVAQDLLGNILVSTIGDAVVQGIITETEAYGGSDDAASHAASGTITARNASMFGPVGHTYVYRSYGMHRCLNLVARDAHAIAGGVLIRSIIPCDGLVVIKQRRRVDDQRLLTNGPGKVGQALGLSLSHNGINVTRLGLLYVIENSVCSINTIQVTPRIGISRNKDLLWRFVAR